MKTIEKKQNLDVIPKNQLVNIEGGTVTNIDRKINFCPICCTPLSDDNIIDQGNGRYRYLCPGCGSKGHLNM